MLITGIQAAGKSIVGRLLAERFARAAFIDGDVAWKLIVAGAEDMTPDVSPEALRQLPLRDRGAALLARAYRDAGFTAVCADHVYGDDIAAFAHSLGSPAAVIVIRRTVDAVLRRCGVRGGAAYRGWDRDGVEAAVPRFDRLLDEGTRPGLWLDSSDMTAAETVDAILQRWEEALLPPSSPP